MQFHLSTISLLAAATLFALPTIAAPAPAPASVPKPHTVMFGSPSGQDAGNAVCFKGYYFGAAACPGRWYEDGTCCISDELELKKPKESPEYTDAAE